MPDLCTNDQNLDWQLDALREHGCERFYRDIVSGVSSSRPGLDEMLKNTRPNDVIVIGKLDRLGRSLKHLVELALSLLYG